MVKTLYAARTAPVRGLNTALDPMALPDGVVSVLSNFRIGNGILEARGGQTAKLNSTTLATSAYRGHWSGYVFGGYYVAVAVYDSSISKTQVYISSDCVTWTVITSASSTYGDTRLSNNTLVRFAVVPSFIGATYTQTGKNCLIFADGGAIRVATAASAAGTTVVYDITPQSDISTTPVRCRAIEMGVNLQGAGATFIGKLADDSTAQTDFLLSYTGSAPNKQIRLTITSSVVTDSITKMDLGYDLTSLFDSSTDRVLLLGIDTAYTMLWDKVKLELRTAATGGTVKVLWDPENPDDYAAPIPIAVDNSNRTIWAFKFTKETGAISYTHTIFRWVAATNEAPTATVTADIFLHALTYGSAGFSDWSLAVTNYNVGSRTESAGAIYSNYVTDRISDWGGPVLNGLKLPRHPAIDCIFMAKVKNPSSTDAGRGVVYCNFYFKTPGDSRYRYGTQVATSGSAGALVEMNAGPDYAFVANTSSVYLPDAYHVSAPNAAELHFVNDRLFVGQVANTQESLMISEYRQPFRFRKFTDRRSGAVDADAPVTMSLGSHNVTCIKSMASSLIGSDTIFVFTDQGLFATGGSTSGQLQQLARVSKFGTISPYTVEELNGKLFYLDTEMQVRELAGGQPQNITRSWVDNNLAGIPAAYRKYATGAVWDEKYYLGYAPSGATTNTAILVWDDEDRQWVIDAPITAAQGLASWFDGTNLKKRLLLFGPRSGTATTLDVFEYDLSTQTQDLGTTNITCAVTFPEIHAEDGKAIMANRVGVTCDDVTGATGTITRTYKPDGSTGTTSLDLDATGNQIVRYDANQTIAGGAGNGVSAKVAISLPLTAGKKVYKIVAEIEPRGHAYDRSA